MDAKKSVKFYNRVAFQRDRYDEIAPIKVMGEDGFKQMPVIINKYVNDGMKILDVGCGPGRVVFNLYRMTDKKVKMIGIDNSPNMIMLAKKKVVGIKNISFFVADAFNTEFKNNSFDIVINRLGPMSYDETYRILKPDGLFFLFVCDKGDWIEAEKMFGFREPLGIKNQVSSLKKSGFCVANIHKFFCVDCYRDIDSFVETLEIIPFIPLFDKKKQAKKLKEYVKKYKNDFGIKASHKRALIIAKK